MAGPGRGRTVHGEQRRHARDGGMLDISPFTQPTRNTRLDRISVCRPRHNMLHGPTWGASAAQSRRAPYCGALLGKWAPRGFSITGTCSYGGLRQRGVRDGGVKHPWSRKGTSVLTGSRRRCCTSADAARGLGAA